jgi:hypothetical protein
MSSVPVPHSSGTPSHQASSGAKGHRRHSFPPLPKSVRTWPVQAAGDFSATQSQTGECLHSTGRTDKAARGRRRIMVVIISVLAALLGGCLIAAWPLSMPIPF